MDAIAPTRERLRHAYGYDVPERSQTASRLAYSVRNPFETMERSGRISCENLLAANKLIYHYLGAQGVRVGNGDGSSDPDTEFPEIYHGQMLAIAWKQVTPDEKYALTELIEERATVEAIGRRWMGANDRGRAEMAGRALVRTALDRLARHWGFRQRSDP